MKKYKPLRMILMFLAICLINLQFGILPIRASAKFSAIFPKEEILTVGFIRDWGQWFPTSYSGLDQRVRCEGYNESSKKYTWNAQFKNRYNDTIHFNWEMVDQSEPSIPTTNRTSIRSGGITDIGFGKSLNTQCSPGATIDIIVDQVRFGENDSGPFVKPE